MPKLNLYVPEEEMSTIKEYDEVCPGESKSVLLLEAAKARIIEKKNEIAGLKDCTLFIGKNDIINNSMEGKKIKFNGRVIGGAKVTDTPYNNEWVTLYYTRKGQFLVFHEIDDYGTIESEYEVVPTLNELYRKGLPQNILKAAEKTCPNVACEELDI